MQVIHKEEVQHRIDSWQDQDLYVHLEMTMGAYAAHFDSNKQPAANFLTNAVVRYSHGTIAGDGPFYRVGLKMDHGWIYTEGLTEWDETDADQLILAGHDAQGKLVVSLQLSREPF
ncbi:hypothetical protein J2Z69_000101 [Paenibacillus shirakamiensis]|uniref:DUF1806 family protein n=1 Tax=Paenibacillus shirakamiensis TaxID=1265935 RepID=A0ABS4JBJ6_9BACL|nr:YojF family protein [Paenibacillus shirakamiensis]MBP1999082.1 hypothetical protein [Paenibacillus shirakamiensis]